MGGWVTGAWIGSSRTAISPPAEPGRAPQALAFFARSASFPVVANKFPCRGWPGWLSILTPLLLAVGAVWCTRPAPPRDSDCDCTANLYNCPDFPTQHEAQACFEHCRDLGAGDIHRLDRDHDGIACEWNRL